MKTLEFNDIEFSLEGIAYITYAEQYYGPGKFLAIHYYNDENVLIPITDYWEYLSIHGEILRTIKKIPRIPVIC